MTLGWVAAALAAEGTAPPPVPVRVLAPRSAEVGRPVDVAVILEVPAGWHVYWENPGQSGLATDAGVTAPDATVEGPYWPVPVRFEADGIVNYGYGEPTALLFGITPAAAGPLPVSATVSWLVCRNVCVPGNAEAHATIEVRPAGAPPPRTEDPAIAQLDAWRARLPLPFAASGGEATLRDGLLRVRLPGTAPVEVFPSTGLEAVWRPTVTTGKDEVRIEGSLTEAPTGAFLVVTRGAGATRRGYLLPVPPEAR